VNEEQAPPGADRVPTLTEVVELHAATGQGAGASPWVDGPVPEGDVPPAPPPEAGWNPEPAAPPAPPPVDTHALVTEVLAELQPRLDMLFEARLREALAPALARAAEGLIREARGELGSALHGLVDDAVKRALQRRGAGR
jgi:hypothetical protein